MAFVGFTGNSLMGGIWSWLGAIVLFLVAFAEIPDFEEESPKQSLPSWWHGSTNAFLRFSSGSSFWRRFFRVYRLAEVPAEMTSDHAEKLIDVQDILDGQRPIFLPRNTGREAVQFYLTAFLVRFTPLHHEPSRLESRDSHCRHRSPFLSHTFSEESFTAVLPDCSPHFSWPFPTGTWL